MWGQVTHPSLREQQPRARNKPGGPGGWGWSGEALRGSWGGWGGGMRHGCLCEERGNGGKEPAGVPRRGGREKPPAGAGDKFSSRVPAPAAAATPLAAAPRSPPTASSQENWAEALTSGSFRRHSLNPSNHGRGPAAEKIIPSGPPRQPLERPAAPPLAVSPGQASFLKVVPALPLTSQGVVSVTHTHSQKRGGFYKALQATPPPPVQDPVAVCMCAR